MAGILGRKGVLVLKDMPLFTDVFTRVRLRTYQVVAAEAILKSVAKQLGRSIVVMFPRQSGKNELQAHLEAYLLAGYRKKGAEMVKISPTWKPQSINAMRRLERVLERNDYLAHIGWKKENGFIYQVGKASLAFFSGEPQANIVGATASLLLEVDEAQDVLIGKYDKEIAPMAASTNATRVFWGTAWTSQTLLGRELRAARAAEAEDGEQRAFVLNADEVAAEVPAYGRHVAGVVAKLGRDNIRVRTQYFSEEIDSESGMFPERRRALMITQTAAVESPQPGKAYALLVDVAGEDSGAEGKDGLANPRRDATALTVVEVDFSTLKDAGLCAPTYRCAWRRVWVGASQPQLYAELRALTERWAARWVVVDATGIGAGLAAFLAKALPGRVLPFTFSAVSKSQLGWDFLTIVDAGRWREPCFAGSEQAELAGLFMRQLAFCQSEVLPGAEGRMKWGVPDGTRDPVSGELVHDDLVVSAALSAVLERQAWGVPGTTVRWVRRADPLAELDKGF